jgi:hypothetical protein
MGMERNTPAERVCRLASKRAHKDHTEASGSAWQKKKNAGEPMIMVLVVVMMTMMVMTEQGGYVR